MTVSGSNLPRPASPNICRAAMPRMVDCIDTLTVGTAILSLSRKSAIVFTFGLRVTRINGTAAAAETAFTWPLVRDHRSSMLLIPLVTKSSWPASSASVDVPPLPMVTQFTLKLPRPAALACFSMSFSCSTTTTDRYGSPYCFEMRISETSARSGATWTHAASRRATSDDKRSAG